MERRILVVDDSPTQAERVRLLIEGEGYRVEVAANGCEGLRRVQLAPPDLIISDVVMPEMDGFAFCRAVKSAEATRRIPFVLLTQWSALADIIQGFEAGADNIISKPFADATLLERVRRIFEQLDRQTCEGPEQETTLHIGDHRFVVSAGKAQILELLLFTLEEKLRESEERFRSVAQSAPDAIIIANDSGQIISWNKGAQGIFGYALEEVVGKPITILMPERYRDAHEAGLERFKSTGEAHLIGRLVEVEGLRKNGSDFPLEFSLASWQTGEERFFSAILRDITERKQLQMQLDGNGRRADAGVARYQSPPGSGLTPQIAVPRERVPRAADPAQRDPRLLRVSPGPGFRPLHRETGPLCGPYPQQRHAPPRADQRPTRPLKGGGGAARSTA